MIIPYEYTYLTATLIFFIPWLAIYYSRKDLRKEMVIMSFLIAVSNIIISYFFLSADWWYPATIIGTRVGVEDFLLGFTNGGIAAVLHQALFRHTSMKEKENKQTFGASSILLLFFLIIYILFYGFKITSFSSVSIAFLLIGLLLVYLRPDLLPQALVNGLLMIIVSLPIYYLVMLVSPGWIDATWSFSHLSGIKFTGIPIEDLIFYFMFGFSTGTLYKYWQCERLVKKYN